MNCFEILGIDPTTEIRAIRKAYAAKSRQFHPEEQPEEFKQLHDAYQMALAWARNPESGQGEFTPESPMAEELVQAEGGPAESGTEEELVYTEEEDREGEPPLPEDWQESFSRIAGASMDNAGLAQAVRRIMGHCRALYGQEQEKGKLYRCGGTSRCFPPGSSWRPGTRSCRVTIPSRFGYGSILPPWTDSGFPEKQPDWAGFPMGSIWKPSPGRKRRRRKRNRLRPGCRKRNSPEPGRLRSRGRPKSRKNLRNRNMEAEAAGTAPGRKAGRDRENPNRLREQKKSAVPCG